MRLRTLDLAHFRNITSIHLEPTGGLNLFTGANAQGKTNLLEAIAFLGLGCSFRDAELGQLVRHQQQEAHIQATTTTTNGDDRWSASITSERKEIQRNGKTVRGSRCGLPCVLFSPDETTLLREAPAARRRYLDRLLVTLHPSYRPLLRDYERVVTQRNRLLNDDTTSRQAVVAQLPHWDDQLVTQGSQLIEMRVQWVEKLKPFLRAASTRLASDDGDATLNYLPSCGADFVATREQIAIRLTSLLYERRTDERDRRVTLVGPHRDDWRVTIGGDDAKRFASQGQHRSLILALKLAEMELRRQVLGDLPITLLDDVMSELDRKRAERLLMYVREYGSQVFLTTTEGHETSADAVFEIRSGSALPLYF